jgi:hypothetical protein
MRAQANGKLESLNGFRAVSPNALFNRGRVKLGYALQAMLVRSEINYHPEAWQSRKTKFYRQI